MLCAALLIPTAPGSDALGSTIYDYTLDICDGTYPHPGGDVERVQVRPPHGKLRHLHPSGSISPWCYGTLSVVSKQSVADMAKSLETDGHRVLSGINGDYFVMATGDPPWGVVTDRVLGPPPPLPPSLGFLEDAVSPSSAPPT